MVKILRVSMLLETLSGVKCLDLRCLGYRTIVTGQREIRDKIKSLEKERLSIMVVLFRVYSKVISNCLGSVTLKIVFILDGNTNSSHRDAVLALYGYKSH